MELTARFPALDAAGARLLLLGAHADDIELGAGGTVARLLAAHPAAAVTWWVGSAAGGRVDEAGASAADYLRGHDDAEVHVERLPDGHFPAAWTDVKEHLERLRAGGVEPTLILAPRPSDRHQDHRVLGELVWTVWRDHAIWHYEIPKYEGDLGRPTLYVPLTEADIEAKVSRLDAHFPSQRARSWWDAELFRGLARLRGVECGATWAEAFEAPKLVWGG